MSIVDAQRPRLVVMENVAPMAGFMRGVLLQLCMRVMMDMGYAVRAAVLQAAQYGVPQSRRRLILVGAAPGYDLAPLPKPSHTFISPENKADNHVRN